MSIGSDIGDKRTRLEDLSGAPRAGCPSEAVPYILSLADALIIVFSSLAGGIGYQLSVGYPMPNILPYCAVGLLASLIHILRMRGSDYYDFPDCAKPRNKPFYGRDPSVEEKEYAGQGHEDIAMALSVPFRGKSSVLDDTVAFLNAHLANGPAPAQ